LTKIRLVDFINYIKNWFLGKRVFSRLKLIVLVLAGFISGYLFDNSPYFSLFLLLMFIDEFYSKK